MLRYRLFAAIALSTTVYASPAPHRSALTNSEEVLDGNRDFYPYLSEGQKEVEVITVSDWAGYVQEYSIELPRAAILTEQGWLSRWLALGGEGEVVIHVRFKSCLNECD